MKKSFLVCLVVVSFIFDASANITLPELFNNHMVLQRDQAIPVWGWAAPGEKITVLLDKQKKQTVAGKNGKWMVKLDPEKAGGPFQLTVKGKNNIVIDDVLIGEVWFCSGQSNMEMPIAGWGEVNNYKQEIADANYPQIRQFNVTKNISAFALDTAKGKWMECKSANAGDFIATGYFFARELNKKLNVPVGIINCSWGGSMIETWISRDAFEGNDEFKSMIQGIPADSIEARAKFVRESVQKGVEQLQGHLPAREESEKWKNEVVDDSKWTDIKLPGLWEEQNKVLKELDGVVWFRKNIVVNNNNAGRPGILSIGQPDDEAEVFLNGVKLNVIKAGEAALVIPPGTIKAGENLVAIRVEDYGGVGGIKGKASDMTLKFDDATLPLDGLWKFRIGAVENQNSNPNSNPTLLYNAMVHPVIPYAIKGALWYQGETNSGRAFQYRKAFPLLIANWRKKWNEGDFPFYFVQLASFDANGGNSEKGSGWAELREAQTLTLSVPNTGMAVTTDIGDAGDIHPKNKQDVGKRLALIALKNTYGVKVASSGPTYTSMKKDGNKVILSFANVDGGFISKDKYGYVKGFEVAGADKKFHWAKANIEGDKIIVYSDKVSDPQAVHYAWSDDTAEASLFNGVGLPTAPFRTDNWPGVTDKEKYAP